MNLTIPELSLVVLIGPSGCGKSSFARAHFKPTEVLSSDFCRGLVSDDENAQAATKDAFEVLHFVARKRLAAGRLTVVDATNVQPEARKPLVALAREFHVLPVAIVLNLPEKLCHERNQNRPDRQFGPHVVRNQSQQLRRSQRGLEREGFRHVFTLSTPEEVSSVSIVRQPLWNNLKHEHGPFDIVGDVHGCYEELSTLLGQLGYKIEDGPDGPKATPPDGRKAVFVGDLVDRGPRIPDVLRLVMRMVAEGTALCVPGNHDMKLMKKLKGRDVQMTHGLADSVQQLDKESPELKQAVIKFLDDLVSHYVFDDGKLVVAHAGMKEEMQGRGSGKVRDFALYGETTGETDDYGLPVRYNWAAEYRGTAMVVYGHTPIAEPEWLNRTINIDTGCVFGGKLTALRYPERELVSVPALHTYYESVKPFLAEETSAPSLTAQQQQPGCIRRHALFKLRDGARRSQILPTARQFNLEMSRLVEHDEPADAPNFLRNECAKFILIHWTYLPNRQPSGPIKKPSDLQRHPDSISCGQKNRVIEFSPASESSRVGFYGLATTTVLGPFVS